ncbi:aquaporin-4-like [Planoprotostelium fungivorum]|uniref:Aquaporin-4-like n=1 Tax=Planoprotostelium fungivorum TaxID=1890364 RepID=A0A2P6NGJ7_9EUKA|nr:aquaporin-4-like [Planoprotostelium fungivorum]
MESHAVTTSRLAEQEHFSQHHSKWGRFVNSFKASSQAFTITAVRQYCAEFLGTLLFVYVGTGTVVALAAKDALNTASTNTCIALSFGFGVACMVYATANVSGGHLNPAITVAFLCTGNIDTIRGIFYILSQCAGAIGAAGLIRATTPSADWMIVAGGATRLGPGIPVIKGLFLEVIITYMLIFTVFGTVQLRNSSTGMGKLAGLAIGLAVLVSHTFGVSFTGPSMNPARSLGPAVVFSEWSNHWIYWVGPLVGGILAAITYQFVLQPEDKERADLRYRKKMLRQQRRLAKGKRATRVSSFFSHKSREVHTIDPDDKKKIVSVEDEVVHKTDAESVVSDAGSECSDADDPNYHEPDNTGGNILSHILGYLGFSPPYDQKLSRDSTDFLKKNRHPAIGCSWVANHSFTAENVSNTVHSTENKKAHARERDRQRKDFESYLKPHDEPFEEDQSVEDDRSWTSYQGETHVTRGDGSGVETGKLPLAASHFTGA